MKLDYGSILGLGGAMSVICYTILLGGHLSAFVDIPSIILVVGGTSCAGMIKFGLTGFLKAGKVAVTVFVTHPIPLTELISKSVELAAAARKGGLLSLEGVEIAYPYMKKGIQFVVDGLEPEVVRMTLAKEMVQTSERHALGKKMFMCFGDVAPAMGIIGTLIGLVHVLGAMNDPKSIGPAMALAFLATMYGAVTANLIYLPFADKLELRAKQEREHQCLMIDAVMAIQSGQNPRMLEEMLKSYLSTKERLEYDEYAKEKADGSG